MDAWSGEPIPASLLAHRTPLERQGALLFQSKQCHTCHALGERGGQRGPPLDAVAVRLNPDQLIRQGVQGGGDMAAYGTSPSPPADPPPLALMGTLHPPGQMPARDASQSFTYGRER